MVQIGVPTFFPPKSPFSLEKMGLLPSAFSLMWGSAFGATAHDDVHDAAHDAFMTLPHHTNTREGEGQLVVNRSFPLAFFALSVKLLLYILE